ncbi:hypothetical protein BWQ96_05947 [Gracilariopsis chorda]|uniref:ASPIC/UnbV domain-containing protein n=1 Tax=Gracilariopsis chorda TaxID=448386 RepID=A0A2V3IT79_9FLOR|nr:hypothetical protein BWQ96_05947 [Gracilariopsis chorda]|eukprot:PXF44320.1 hypothetical protein BWQ96_05947 [Gracilariopsis chorda]
MGTLHRCFTFALVLVVHVAFAQFIPSFTDVSQAAGLPNNPRKKYASPAVADLDRDGHPDLLFCNHDNYFAELFFNNGDGTFTKSRWQSWRDNHGIVPVPVSIYTKNMRFTISPGGNFGMNPSRPQMYEVSPHRSVNNITFAVDDAGGSGRTAIFLDMAFTHTGFPDVIFMNAPPADGGRSHFGYENRFGRYELRRLEGFEDDDNWYGSAIDVDNDRVMEIVTHYYMLTAYRMAGPFKFVDATSQIFPAGLGRMGVVAVAEIDYDNDGDFDLYVARTKSSDLKWVYGDTFYDYLLENVGGRFVDVTAKAGIPRGTLARGVTVGDFNNDGWMDVFVTQYRSADIMLLNTGDGTFRRVDGLISRPDNVRGDNAVAFDYDGDGRLDLISSQGDYHTEGVPGNFKLFRNVMTLTSKRNYLRVRVGNAPDGVATALHAVVTVTVNNNTPKMIQRVGSPGAAISRSYIETLHFGLGPHSKAAEVSVKYTNGYTVSTSNVAAASTVVLGNVL